MPIDPLHALFGQYRREILGVLLARPDESFHTRELERLTGVPVGSLARELKTLVAGGILLREKRGNQVHYTANRASPVFEELAGLFRKTSGIADVLRKALGSFGDDVQLALVFGSVASGAAKPASDLDVLVVGRVALRKVVSALSPLSESLRREINPVVMSPEKFYESLRRDERLIVRIKHEPKIFVKGTQHDFEQPGGHRKA